MKISGLRAISFAHLLASGALMASQVKTMSYHDWKDLLGRAQTSGEFHALAQFCRSRAEAYRKKLANCESELRGYHSQRSPQSTPKHPTRDQTLTRLSDHYSELAKQWEELGGSLSAKADGLEK